MSVKDLHFQVLSFQCYIHSCIVIARSEGAQPAPGTMCGAVLSKLLVQTRVVAGPKVLTTHGKLYKVETPVQVVVDSAIATLDGGMAMAIEEVRSFNTQIAFDSGERGTTLDEEDLEELTVENLRDELGKYLIVRVDTDSAKKAPPPGPLKSAFEKMAANAAGLASALPPKTSGEIYWMRIHNALVELCTAKGLGFHAETARKEACGGGMFHHLSKALEYLLPFDDAKPSPLRPAGRVHLIIPEMFTTKVRM